MLISDWERRSGGGEAEEDDNLHDTGRGMRRVSQDFKELRQKFVDHMEGGEEEFAGGQKSPSTRLSFLTTQGRGAVRKIDFTNFEHSSIVGRGALSLAGQTANKKRKMELEAEQTESERKRCCFIKK